MNTSDVLNRLTYHKVRQGPLLDYLEKVDSKLASRIAGCGTWLHFREFLLSGETRVRNANLCKCFLGCPACAANRCGKLVSPYALKVEAAMDMMPGLMPVMITTTIKNGPDLPERLGHVRASWSRMMAAKRKGASKSGRHETIEWNKVVGSIRSIEVKLGKGSGLWHPHMHTFALVSEKINKFHLSAEWERFTGDSMIVDVTECKNGIVSGLIETLKYVSKPSELKPPDLHHLLQSAKGMRFADAQGCLRGVPEPCLETDDDDGLHGPWRDFIALWRGYGYSIESVGQRLEILRPGDAGYGAPREHIYQDPGPETLGDPCKDQMASLPARGSMSRGLGGHAAAL